jgi:hypothetical protein
MTFPNHLEGRDEGNAALIKHSFKKTQMPATKLPSGTETCRQLSDLETLPAFVTVFADLKRS